MERASQVLERTSPLTSERLLQELRQNSHVTNAPGHDERIANFSIATLVEYKQSTSVKDVIEEFTFARPNIQPSLAANILLRSVQKQLLRLEDSNPRQNPYPEPYNRILPWRSALRTLTDLGSPYRSDFLNDLHTRTPQSNIVERYKSLSLIVQLMRGRFDPYPAVYDIGCSQNHGLKRLALNKNIGLPFRRVEVVGRGTAFDKKMKSHILNTLLDYSHGIGDSIGIDTQPIDDPDRKEWSKVCSFYPGELLDREHVDNYDLLDLAEPTEPRIDFLQGDFSQPETAKQVSSMRPGGADIVHLCAVLDQISSVDKRQRVLDNARKLVKDHGLIVIQDFVHVDPKDATNLQFYENWFARPYRFRTCIADSSDGFQKFHEIMRWDNGRCNKVQLTPAIGKLALAEVMHLVT